MTGKTLYLTTIDNPFHPVDQFEDWYNFDEQHGYHTLGLIARTAVCSPKLDDYTNKRMRDFAIQDIKANDELNFYKIIEVDDEEPEIVHLSDE